MLVNWLFSLSVTLNIVFSVVPGECFRSTPTLKDNCTCETSKGTYSLFPLQRKDGQPRFSTTLPNGYSYTYNPCMPYTFSSKKGICKNVALCKYDTTGSPHVYIDIGEQRDVTCEMENGKMTLIYPIHNYPTVPTGTSKVILVCNNNPEADPKFDLVNEADMIFNLTSHCGCLNGCQPAPVPTEPYSSTTPSSGTKSPSSRPENLNWKLVILLPSLAGFLVLVIVFVCLWRRLSVIQEALLCRCCHCYEYRDISEPERVERIVRATETSSLIKNQMNSRAVEHEDSVAKDKVKDPVQVEDGDVEEDCKFAGKGVRTLVV
ncbi:hypothetical protein ACROYT_G021904 [Oculina patagonica]